METYLEAIHYNQTSASESKLHNIVRCHKVCISSQEVIRHRRTTLHNSIALPSLPVVGANTETEHQNFGLALPRPAHLIPSPSRVEATCHSYPTGIPHLALPIPASRNPDSSFARPLRRHGICLTPHSTEPPTQRPLPLPTTVANRI